MLSYDARIVTFDSEKYNLPVDTIYFLESSWNFKLNNSIRRHREEIETELMSGDYLLPYRFEIISREAPADKLTRYCRWMEGADFKEDSESFSYNFIARIMPMSTESSIIGYFSIDVERISVRRIMEVIRDYAAQLDRFNHLALCNALDYFEIAPQWTKTIGWSADIECSTLPMRVWEPHFFVPEVIPTIDFPRFEGAEPITRRPSAPTSSGRICASRAFSFPIDKQPDSDVARLRDNEELRTLAIQVRDALREIQSRNGATVLLDTLDEDLLTMFRQPESESKFSPVLITPQHNIVLPLYNNLEIPMPTMSKALYMLLMAHPEGIAIKELIDYQDELRTIYHKITCRSDKDAIEQSLVNILDPTGDAINIALSRINGAFRSKLPPHIASYYFVQGGRGEKRYLSPARA